MIAKLIVRAHTREEAITKMERALDEFIVEGIKTTVPFHQWLLRQEDFRDGNFDTGWLGKQTLPTAIIAASGSVAPRYLPAQTGSVTLGIPTKADQSNTNTPSKPKNHSNRFSASLS